jgi:glycosyltransferase Alg8
MALVLYLALLAVLVLNAPAAVLEPGHARFFVLLGAVGAWRYGWGLVHLVRALIYRGLVFPGLRARARALALQDGEDGHREELFLVVTSYRIAPAITIRVYRALIREAIAWDGPVTLVASIVETADERLIKRLFELLDPPERVRLRLVRLPGRGKRHALAVALRAVARARPREDAVVAVMDGDTVLTPGSLAATVPLFRLRPRAMALTTDERPVLVGRSAIARAWLELRFAQRHQIMSSLGLSRRLLAVTGRMSLLRARVATDPTFIDRIENDQMEHWRLGRFRLLTGEDKSSWVWLLERGHEMLYVPDVTVLTLEQPPPGGFARASTALMMRWSGNMLRAGSQALALGPSRIGPFLWWCVVDQRIAVWTPLIAPTLALALGLFADPLYLYAYLLWVMLTRLVQTVLLVTTGRAISGLWPPLLYWNQVWGALVKGWVLFRLDRQRWTRQPIRAERDLMPEDLRWMRLSSNLLHAAALAFLVLAVGFWAGLLGPAWASPLSVSLLGS